MKQQVIEELAVDIELDVTSMLIIDLNDLSSSADTCRPGCLCAHPPTLLTYPCCFLSRDTFSHAAALRRSAGPGADVARNRPAAPAVYCV